MKKLYKAGKWVVRKLPMILAIGASVGVIITAVTSGKAMMRANQLKMEAEQIKGGELSKKEAILAQAPAYVLPVVSAGLTIGCIFGCNYLNRKQQTSLAAAAVAIQKSYESYKNKVIEEFGEDVDRAVKQALAEESAQKDGLPVPAEGNRLFYDTITNQWFCSTMENVLTAEYDFNQRFNYFGIVTLAQYCDMFGLSAKPGYEEIGWNVAWFMECWESCWLDFENHDEVTVNGTPFVMITPRFDPITNVEDYDSWSNEEPHFYRECIQIESREKSDDFCGKEMTA